MLGFCRWPSTLVVWRGSLEDQSKLDWSVKIVFADLAEHHHVRVDEPEGVDHDLALHRLDGVHHHRYGPEGELVQISSPIY